MANMIGTLEQLTERKIIRLLNEALAVDPYRRSDADIRRQYPKSGLIMREIAALKRKIERQRAEQIEERKKAGKDAPEPMAPAPPPHALSREELQHLVKGAFLGAYAEELLLPPDHVAARVADIDTFSTYRVGWSVTSEQRDRFRSDVEVRLAMMARVSGEIRAIIADGDLSDYLGTPAPAPAPDADADPAMAAKTAERDRKKRLLDECNARLKIAEGDIHAEIVQATIENLRQSPSWMQPIIYHGYAAIDEANRRCGRNELDRIVKMEREIMWTITRARAEVLLAPADAEQLLDVFDKAYANVYASARTAIVMHGDKMSSEDKTTMDRDVVSRMGRSGDAGVGGATGAAAEGVGGATGAAAEGVGGATEAPVGEKAV